MQKRNELVTFVRGNKTTNKVRVIYYTDEYLSFYNNADETIKNKIAYLKEILISEKVIKSKYAKKLVDTDFYELRILLNNQYRVIFFTIDSEDLNQSTELLFINAFVKKSTKDYQKQIRKAHKILEQWTEES